MEYEKELQEKNAGLAVKLKETAQGVMRKGKIAKSYKCNQPRSRQESGTKRERERDREGSEVKSIPSLNAVPSQSLSGVGVVMGEGDMTETRKLLRMMSARN